MPDCYHYVFQNQQFNTTVMGKTQISHKTSPICSEKTNAYVGQS